MSNLKKILAVTLAVVMVLAMGVNAFAFTDVKEGDNYGKAINLLASLNVLKGYPEDNTYRPEGTYTREEFAKILYVLMNGKDDGAAMYTGTAPFPDVAADRWSAGYITWAVTLGIINGRDDGLFHPTDIVNYAEASKMFIIAMGYSGAVLVYPYGFIDKAQTLGLFNDIAGYTTFGPANRGTVAQMGRNVLFCEAPRFGTYTSTEQNTTATKTFTVIEGAFGVMRNKTTLSLLGTSTNAYAEPLYADKQISLNGSIFTYADDVGGMIGEPVRVWFKVHEDNVVKSGGVITNTVPRSGDTIILVEKDTNVKTYIVNPKEVNTDDTTADTLIFKQDGVTYRLKINTTADKSVPNGSGAGNNVTVKTSTLTARNWEGDYVGFDVAAAGTAVTDPGAYVRGYIGTDFAADKSATYKVIDVDGNGTIDALGIVTPDFGRVASISSSSIAMTHGELVGSKSIKDDDGNVIVGVPEGLAKDDRALVYPAKAVVGGTIEDTYKVVKAEAVLAAVHTSATNTKYFFDSKEFKFVTNPSSIELSTKYDLYLNQNGYIGDYKKVSDSEKGNWILVTDTANIQNAAGTISSATVTGYVTDGTKKTLNVDLDEVDEDVMLGTTVMLNVDDGAHGTPVGFEDDGAGVVIGYHHVFSYTLGENGMIDSLKSIGHADLRPDTLSAAPFSGSGTYNEDTTVLTVGTNKGFVVNETVIFNVYETTKVAVIPAADLPEFTTAKAIVDMGVKNGNAVVLMIDSGAGSKLGATSGKYGLLIKAEKFAGASSSKAYYSIKTAYDGTVASLLTKEVDKTTGSSASLLTDTLLKVSDDPQYVVGYAKLNVNSSGKLDNYVPIVYGATLTNDGDLSWTHGAVMSTTSNGKGVELQGVTNYHKDANGKTIVTVTGSTSVYVFDTDCKFYTVKIEPWASLANNSGGITTGGVMFANTGLNNVLFGSGKTVSAATSGSFIDSDEPTSGTATYYMADLLLKKDGTDTVVVAVYIYTTPVTDQ